MAQPLQKNCLAIYYEIKHTITIRSCHPTPGYSPKTTENVFTQKPATQVHCGSPQTRNCQKRRMRPPLVPGWGSGGLCTMGYSSALKGVNYSHTTAGLDLKCILPSERRQNNKGHRSDLFICHFGEGEAIRERTDQ